MNSLFCSHLVHLATYCQGHHWNIENIVNKFAALFAKRHSNTIATHTNTKIKILPHSRAQKHKPFQHPPCDAQNKTPALIFRPSGGLRTCQQRQQTCRCSNAPKSRCSRACSAATTMTSMQTPGWTWTSTSRRRRWPSAMHSIGPSRRSRNSRSPWRNRRSRHCWVSTMRVIHLHTQRPMQFPRKKHIFFACNRRRRRGVPGPQVVAQQESYENDG